MISLPYNSPKPGYIFQDEYNKIIANLEHIEWAIGEDNIARKEIAAALHEQIALMKSYLP